MCVCVCAYEFAPLVSRCMRDDVEARPRSLCRLARYDVTSGREWHLYICIAPSVARIERASFEVFSITSRLHRVLRFVGDHALRETKSGVERREQTCRTKPVAFVALSKSARPFDTFYFSFSSRSRLAFFNARKKPVQPSLTGAVTLLCFESFRRRWRCFCFSLLCLWVNSRLPLFLLLCVLACLFSPSRTLFHFLSLEQGSRVPLCDEHRVTQSALALPRIWK